MRPTNLARVVSPTTTPDVTPASPVSRERLRAGPETRPATREARSRVHVRAVIAVLSLLALGNAAGIPYYTAPPPVRVRHAWHDVLRPSGLVGQSAGILAALIFFFLWLYPLRKRWKGLAWTGAVGAWLDVHVISAIALPLLLTMHAAWRSEGLIGLGFDAMLVVCASGVVGRYLYSRVPRTRAGMELSREDVARERNALIGEISTVTGLAPRDIEVSLRLRSTGAQRHSLPGAFWQLLVSDWHRWRLSRELPRRWAALSSHGRRVSTAQVREAVRLARRELALTQQLDMLDATHRIFRFWHVAHRPFAITALLAVTVHVVVVVAVGATWFY